MRTKHDAPTPAVQLPGRGDEFRILRRRAGGFDPRDPATGRAGPSHIAAARATAHWESARTRHTAGTALAGAVVFIGGCGDLPGHRIARTGITPAAG
ncbi:hypothetical protein ACQP0C_39675 [Nocardia sp. CA-129566]|uniref:hypothetical protein n=1 Tax=Nocardia sp. CA-129566 TaxID=3239976 RepID=UPI003D956981